MTAVSGASGHVEVALRIRPLLPSEMERGESVAVTVDNSASSSTALDKRVLSTVHVRKPSSTKSTALGQGKVRRKTAASAALESREFSFDTVVGPEASQFQAFHTLDIQGLCDDAFAGKAVTVFCFGQTGSGKTYTLSGRSMDEDVTGGTASEDGLQFQAAKYIAAQQQRLARQPPPPQLAAAASLSRQSSSATRGKAPPKRGKRSSNSAPKPAGDATQTPQPSTPMAALTSQPTAVTLKASYLELYNECLHDLLQEGKAGLKCRWSAAAQSFFVADSLVVECVSEEDLLVVLREGHAYRHRASHRLNADSSRSHAIFTVFVETQQKASTGGEGARRPAPPVRYGKITFVDLAGSERLKETGSSGDDTKSINRSLFALGNVIEKLSARSGASGDASDFVPYRSSVLTQLLMDSLSGRSRTLMIACVSPSSRFVEESLRTLHYAQRARHIATQPAVRLDAEEEQRMRVQKELVRLRRENKLLREALRIPRSTTDKGGEEEDERGELTAAIIQAHLSALLSACAPPPPPLLLPPRPATTEETPARAGAARTAAPARRLVSSFSASTAPWQAGGGVGPRLPGRLPSLPSPTPPASRSTAQAIGFVGQRQQHSSRQAAEPWDSTSSKDGEEGEEVEEVEEVEEECKGPPTRNTLQKAGGGPAVELAVPPYPFPPAGEAPPLSALDFLDQLPDTAELVAAKRR